MILTIRRQITMEGINDVVRYHNNDTIFIYFTYALRVRKALHILHVLSKFARHGYHDDWYAGRGLW